MGNFFTYMPEGNYSMLNLAHILIIVFGIIAIVVGCFFLRKLERKTVEKVLLGLAIFALTLDPIYWTWELIVTKTLHFETTLPLYFCSLFYITLAVGVFCKNAKVKQTCFSYLATVNIIAGLMGLVFNSNLNSYPVFSFVGLRTLVYHLLMLFVSCFIWFTKYYKPEIKDLYRFVIPLTILFVPAIIVDKVWGFDYCFLNGGKGTVIESISATLPNAIYIILLYMLIYASTVAIFYVPTIVKHIKSKKVSDGAKS